MNGFFTTTDRRAHDDGGETQRPRPRDGVGGTVHQDNAAGVAQILVAEQERVVAIKKDGRPFHRQWIIDAIRRGSTNRGVPERRLTAQAKRAGANLVHADEHDQRPSGADGGDRYEQRIIA